MHTMSRSSTITKPDWLAIPHAGDVLASEFMEPLSLSEAELADALHVDPMRVTSLLAGSVPVDADLDLRLTRYFALSEGFFLRIQTRCDTLSAKRALNGELDRIMPRAA